ILAAQREATRMQDHLTSTGALDAILAAQREVTRMQDHLMSTGALDTIRAVQREVMRLHDYLKSTGALDAILAVGRTYDEIASYPINSVAAPASDEAVFKDKLGASGISDTGDIPVADDLDQRNETKTSPSEVSNNEVAQVSPEQFTTIVDALCQVFAII